MEMMNQRKILYFFPHNPYPPSTGAHGRCLEVLFALKELDSTVVLASSTLSSETRWESSTIQGRLNEKVHEVRVYSPTPLDYRIIGLMRRVYQFSRQKYPVSSLIYTPPGMRRWFSNCVRETSPDVIFMNYAHWDGLVKHDNGLNIFRIIDTLDLVTLNTKIQEILRQYLVKPSFRKEDMNYLLNEDFFEKLNLTADPEEFRIFDQYNVTIAISAREGNAIEKKTNRTRVHLIPVTRNPVFLANTYSGTALFPVGPNPFNVQGYYYFVRRVLPLVRRVEPEFCLQVTGRWWLGTLPPKEEGIILSGFLPDLKVVFQPARFAICPVLSGTGQQIKIVESMAHGLPVVATRFSAETSPLEHGINGLVARDPEEFADYVVRLWRDKALCRRLGRAAREAIASDYSQERLRTALNSILSTVSNEL